MSAEIHTHAPLHIASSLHSSVAMGLAHVVAILVYGDDKLLVCVYLAGVITSLLNHGLHMDAPSKLDNLRTLDRHVAKPPALRSCVLSLERPS